MAKMSFEFDTVSKEISAQVDGKEVANIMGINVYPSYEKEGEYECSLTMMSHDSDSDIKTMTIMHAGESPKGKLLSENMSKEKVFNSDMPTFIGEDIKYKSSISKVERDILKCFTEE